MNIPGTFGQRDARWGSELLGYNTDPSFTLANYGCLVTSISNLLWYTGRKLTPDAVNDELKRRNGFQAGGGLLIWNSVPPLHGDLIAGGMAYQLAEANRYVEPDGCFAIVQVTKPGFPMHFVLLVMANKIVDPWDGQLKPWPSGYTFINAHLYGDRTPDFTTGVQPITAPAITVPKGDIVDKETVNYAYRAANDAEPTADQIKYWVGRPARELMQALYESNELRRWKANNYDKQTAELAAERATLTAKVGDLTDQAKSQGQTIDELNDEVDALDARVEDLQAELAAAKTAAQTPAPQPGTAKENPSAPQLPTQPNKGIQLRLPEIDSATFKALITALQVNIPVVAVYLASPELAAFANDYVPWLTPALVFGSGLCAFLMGVLRKDVKTY